MAAPFSIGSSGREAGQFNGVGGLAVDQLSGGLYVSDRYNHRIQKFDSSGVFSLAWGWAVNALEPKIQLQTCSLASGCRAGEFGGGAGQFSSEGPIGLAVDNNNSLTDSSSGDVYVADAGGNRVEKFDPEGKFLLMFGGHVNRNGTDVCSAAEVTECQHGTAGTGSGQFEWAYRATVAVGPGGLVYVGDKARVEVFEPSGQWRESISLSGLSAAGRVTSLVVDSAGNVFVKDEGVSGVREIGPSGIEAPVEFDVGSNAVEGLALNGSADLFVADSTGGFHVVEYATSSGEELSRFAAKAVSSTHAFAFSQLTDEVYLGNFETENGHAREDILGVAPPAPGPLLVSESASAGLHGAGTLEATLNAEGSETKYYFEYVTQTAFEAGGYSGAIRTPVKLMPKGFEDEIVSTGLSGLAPATYHYRLVASNANGTTTGPDHTFTTVPLEGPWTSEVAGTSATLSAHVNPLGSAAEYRIEYGTSTAYGQTLSGSLGDGTEYVPVARHVAELQSGMEYHYRLVVTNEFGTFQGTDHTFMTQTSSGGALTLPDGRAWELVSPADKKGAIIEPLDFYGRTIKAASGGGAITYNAAGPHVGENPQDGRLSQVLSTREAGGGWRSQDITLSAYIPVKGEQEFVLNPEQIGYQFFSEDLASAAVFSQTPRTPGVKEGTLYLRNNLNESFTPLVSEANVDPPGTEFGGGSNIELQVHVLTVTPDMSHVVFASPLALVPPATFHGANNWNLYEWGGGRLQLLNILPNGTVAVGGTSFTESPMLGGESEPSQSQPTGGVRRAISTDGQRVVWTWGSPYASDEFKGLYVRNTAQNETVGLGATSRLQMMSGDGSRVFYLDGGDLYAYDFAKGSATDLTGVHPGEGTAGVQEVVLGASEDGTTVYFVANGVLTSAPNPRGETATPGRCVNEETVHRLSPRGATCNLYVVHSNGGSWEAPRFIATLSGDDEPSWYARGTQGGPELARVSSRVSPSGRYLAFNSDRSLTGYDNMDAVSGQPDQEVFRYDFTNNELVCVSCNPTGARPVGVDDSQQATGAFGLLVDRMHAWWEDGVLGPSGKEEGHWLAGTIPTWDNQGDGVGTYQPRSLSDNGRVFFDSPDALVPQATNGLEDVYEYEPPAGPGMPASDSCTTESPTYSMRSGGCVNLISSGISSGESVFYDASENGDDAFFLTSARLVSEDYDTSYDVYDAHVCSSGTPCQTVSVASPPCTSGDSCKPAPTSQPEIFGAPPSATFNGVGNLSAQPKKATVKRSSSKGKTHRHKRQRKRKRKKALKSGVRRTTRKTQG